MGWWMISSWLGRGLHVHLLFCKISWFDKHFVRLRCLLEDVVMWYSTFWENNINKLWLSQFPWKPENHLSFDSWLDFLVPKPIDRHYFWGSSSSWDPPSTPLCPKIFDQCSTFDLSKPRGGCWNGRYIFTEIIYRDTVDGTNPANQLRLAVYIIIHRVFLHPSWCRISSISCI